MKKKFFLNANIIDPYNSIDEIGGLIVNEEGKIEAVGKKVNCAVLNAGDGRREHPTQALLDALTIIDRKKKISGLKIAICGDILHSRVARSNIYLLNMLGAELNIVAPSNLMPKDIEKL